MKYPIYCKDCGEPLSKAERLGRDTLCKECAPDNEAGRKTF